MVDRLGKSVDWLGNPVDQFQIRKIPESEMDDQFPISIDWLQKTKTSRPDRAQKL